MTGRSADRETNGWTAPVRKDSFMYSTDIMRAEHDNIFTFLGAVRALCCQVLEGLPLPVNDFRKIIAFARNYSDHQHHGKEENFLFNEMVANLGPIADKLINHGMLVEHDLCRRHIMDLETALNLYERDPKPIHKLDILEAAEGYATVLHRHISKENSVVYPLAERSFSEEIVLRIDRQVQAFESKTSEEGVQDHYLAMMNELRDKYGQIEDQHDKADKSVSLAAAFGRQHKSKPAD